MRKTTAFRQWKSPHPEAIALHKNAEVLQKSISQNIGKATWIFDLSAAPIRSASGLRNRIRE